MKTGSFNILNTTTTTKPYPTKWGWLHGSNDAVVFNILNELLKIIYMTSASKTSTHTHTFEVVV